MNLKPLLGKRFLKREKLGGLIIEMPKECKESGFGLFNQGMTRKCFMTYNNGIMCSFIVEKPFWYFL